MTPRLRCFATYVQLCRSETLLVIVQSGSSVRGSFGQRRSQRTLGQQVPCYVVLLSDDTKPRVMIS